MLTFHGAVHYQRKHAAQIISNQKKLSHSRPLLQSFNVLNVYQINLVFNDIIDTPVYQYTTKLSKPNFSVK